MPERAAEGRVGILVVDDRPSKLLAMEALLSDLGEHVVCVSSGADALRHLLERDFAVVLLDVNMPEMDGFETAAFIRQRPRSRHVPIIFMTAGSDETNALQGYSLGAVDYILTPIVPEVLRTKVKVFVDLYRMTDQLKRQAEERIALADERAARAVAEEARRRTELLAEAGKSLGRSLDLDSTIRAICDLFVPDLAESVRLRLVGSGGAVSVEAAAGAPVAKEFEAAAAEGADAAARSGVLQLVRSPGASREVLGVAYPLVARETVVGVLLLAAGERRGPYDAATLVLIEALGTRAAPALDNCLLYQEIEQRDLRKDQFVAMLAHELRNPLGAITSAVGVLEHARVATGAEAQALAVMQRQLRSLTLLVDDLLDVSRVTGGKITLHRATLDLAAHVERCLETFRATGTTDGHAIAVQSRPAWIDGDPTRLDQVIGNLIGNAVKYTRPGGRIGIRVEPDGAEAVLEISDSGIGMSAEVLARVFDLFFQADGGPDRAQGGLGVGLTLVRQLVELHGGTIQAASPGPGEGSRFTARFPLSAARTQAEPRRPEAAAGSAGARIVVVEDNADARQMLVMLLSLGGHDVREAGDGLEGIAVTEEVDPDIVFVDVGLPGLDGYEVARTLRAAPRGSQRLLVALTGYGQPEDRRRALDAGFDDHIVKPVDPSRLTEVIATLQRSRRTSTDRTRA